MPTGSFYVYVLLDPRKSPPMPFYIGKGSGSRAYAHLAEDGEGRKNRRIAESYMERGEVDAAIENYERALELNPTSAGAREKLAELRAM